MRRSCLGHDEVMFQLPSSVGQGREPGEEAVEEESKWPKRGREHTNLMRERNLVDLVTDDGVYVPGRLSLATAAAYDGRSLTQPSPGSVLHSTQFHSKSSSPGYAQRENPPAQGQKSQHAKVAGSCRDGSTPKIVYCRYAEKLKKMLKEDVAAATA